MSTCSKCLFWQEGGSAYSFHKIRICQIADYEDVDRSIPDDGMALHAAALDDSGLEFALRTGPDFGCNKFQEKKA